MATIFHVSVDYLIGFDSQSFDELESILSREDVGWEINIEKPNDSVPADTFRLLSIFESFDPDIKKHLLIMIEEMNRILNDKSR